MDRNNLKAHTYMYIITLVYSYGSCQGIYFTCRSSKDNDYNYYYLLLYIMKALKVLNPRHRSVIDLHLQAL